MAKTTEAICEIARKLGLKMSHKKTEVMSIGQASVSNHIVPPGNGGLIKVVNNFKYLEAFCSANGTNVKQLDSRIGKASTAIDKVRRDSNTCIHVSGAHSLSVMIPDLMPLTCAASTRFCRCMVLAH